MIEARSILPAATIALYHDCSPEDAAAATARMQPQAANLTAERTPLTSIPQIASGYIVCRQDHGVSESWAVATAPERRGSTVCFIDSSHTPYWSRPAELAALLSG